MAVDIFISYSSHDRGKAEQLTELLSSAGFSVWIDNAALNAASSWSKEIVSAINGCTVFIVLLSPASLDSHNVVKEVSLASEKRKKILPLDLEPVTLTEDFEYQLAGIQRAPMTNIDAIIRALGKLGLEATKAPELTLVKETDGRKSLMILPFEDLSPTGDNGWFADGIVSELITALTHIKALRVADQQATKDFKRYQGSLPDYARETRIRYFIQGDVRKFGDQIKVTSRLLDIETGDHLWDDSMKGTMDDIFDIQEKVAQHVVEGLKVHLGTIERMHLTQWGTDNPEAYELLLRGREYFNRQTKDGFELAAQLWSEAIALDPGYIKAYLQKAIALASLYRNYSRDPRLLDEGIALITEALRIEPDNKDANSPLSAILVLQGHFEKAENAAKDYVRHAPDDYNSHFALGFCYMNSHEDAKAIAPFEEAFKLNPDHFGSLLNLIISCSNAKDTAKQEHYALLAIPKVERHLKLFPDDEARRVFYPSLFHFAGREEEAKVAIRSLGDIKDAVSLYNLAYLQCMLHDNKAGLDSFAKAINAGFRNTSAMQSFLSDEDGGGALKGSREYEAVRERVDAIIAQEDPKKLHG